MMLADIYTGLQLSDALALYTSNDVNFTHTTELFTALSDVKDTCVYGLSGNMKQARGFYFFWAIIFTMHKISFGTKFLRKRKRHEHFLAPDVNKKFLGT